MLRMPYDEAFFIVHMLTLSLELKESINSQKMKISWERYGFNDTKIHRFSILRYSNFCRDYEYPTTVCFSADAGLVPKPTSSHHNTMSLLQVCYDYFYTFI
jgi:hypothetical protein